MLGKQGPSLNGPAPCPAAEKSFTKLIDQQEFSRHICMILFTMGQKAPIEKDERNKRN